MKLPIPLLLYMVSLGLFGLAGWTFYEMLPLWRDPERQAATTRGVNDARDRLGRGKGQGPVSVDWQYTKKDADWWAGLKHVNLIGKLPPPPEKPTGPDETPKPVVVDVRPLDQIIELVSLFYDGKTQGKGGETHVIVRYKPEADVQPPEWYVRENTAPAPSSVLPVIPRDVSPTRPGGNRPPASNPGNPAPPPQPVRPNVGARTTSPMPTSLAGHEVLQKIWAQSDGDPRHGANLWPKFSEIKLVRVSADATSAFFVRVLPPPKEGDPAPEPKEEELIKTSWNLSQDVLQEMRRLQGRPVAGGNSGASGAATQSSGWIDVDETKMVGSVRQISKKDEERFRTNSDELFEQLNLDTYVSKSSNLRGLVVRNVDAQLASKFGVAAGEVLIEINGRPVQSKAQAVQLGKADYKRGVRTFATKWLANGAIVERTYQAPDR